MNSFIKKALFGSLFLFFAPALQAGNFEDQHTMNPINVTEDEEQLYLSPGGKYTIKDILANGRVTRSQKYGDFVATPIIDPKVGDVICPVTLRKADPKYTWIIGGQTYSFCCPLCIDEFLALAKEHPEQIKNADEYILRK